MSLKKGIVNVNGKEIEQYVLQNKSDIDKFFKSKKGSILSSLKKSFINYVGKGDTIILDTETNMVGFYSWRTTGKENWKLISLTK